MNKKDRLFEVLRVRVPRDTEQKLYMLAVMKGVTRSEVLREAIAEKLQRELKANTAQEEGSEAGEHVKGDNYVNHNLYQE